MYGGGGMSEEEQIALAMRESLASYSQEHHAESTPTRSHDRYHDYGVSTGDEELARAIQESLNNVDGNQSSFVYGGPSKPPDHHAYQRHQDASFPTTSGNHLTKREIRMVFLGMTGSGKSSSANTVIGREEFKADCDGSSITSYCSHASSRVQGRDALVVDTPGLFDTRQGNDDTMREITRCVALSAPGPHALILVVQGGNRQTEQVQRCADIIMDVFGEQARRYMIILFTHRDDLDYHRQSLDDFVQTLPPKMKQVLQRCGNRYLAFNNRSTGERDAQVGNLFKMIDRMVTQNGGHCFTNDVYKDFEKMLIARERKLKEKLEKKKQRELQIIQDRVETETRQQLEELQERERRQQIKHAEAEQERKHLEAKMNEKFDKKFKDLEDQYKKKEDNLRSEVRREVQDDEEGTGDLFDKGMHMLGKGFECVGNGIKKLGSGIKVAGKGVAAVGKGLKNVFAFGMSKIFG